MDTGRGVHRVLSEGRRQEAGCWRESPAGRAPAPRLIRFVSGPALGCQLSPGRGAGGGRAQPVGWAPLCALVGVGVARSVSPFSSLVLENFVFSVLPRVGDFWKISYLADKNRWKSAPKYWLVSSASHSGKQGKNQPSLVLQVRSQTLSSQFKRSPPPPTPSGPP